jgi:hypothetical protein
MAGGVSMRPHWCCVFLALVILAAISPPAPVIAQTQDPKRIALVIGNSSYRSFPRLANTINDRDLVAAALKDVAFDVMSFADLDHARMRRAVNDFSARLHAERAVGLFYFAGHGVQVEGTNYLIPVDATPRDYRTRAAAAVRLSLTDILGQMAANDNDRLNIVVLDACRSNPLKATGLANIRHKLPKSAQFFIAYSTSPEDVASDTGIDTSHGPYAAALTSAMRKPWLSIDRVFTEVHDVVANDASLGQFPWHTRSFTGEFYFKLGDENDFWARIRNSLKGEDFGAFLQQFPRGRFARNACIRRLELAQLERMTVEERRASDLAVQLRSRIAERINICPEGVEGSGQKRTIFANSTDQALADADLSQLSCDDLWAARNEMFARNGYCFRNFEASRYFGNKACSTTYDSIFGATTPQFKMLRSNVYKIQAFEALSQCAPKE